MSGTKLKKRAKCPLFNDFCVPQKGWDKLGTTTGHGTGKFMTRQDSPSLSAAATTAASLRSGPLRLLFWSGVLSLIVPAPVLVISTAASI